MPRSLAAFLALAFVFAFAPPSMAQSAIGPGGVFGQPGQAGTQKATNLNTSRSNVARKADPKKGSAARATTVKSSKSNTSDRATTVKSSKSNTSD